MRNVMVAIVVGLLLVAQVMAGTSSGQVIWQFETEGEVWSSPLVHAGTVLFGSDDGKIYSLDSVSGARNWSFTTGGRVRSRGTLCATHVLFTSDDGHLYALDPQSGEEVWRFDLGSAEIPRRLPAPGPPYDYDYMASSPVCSSGDALVGSADGHLYSLDARAGEERWKFKTNGRIRSTPLVHEGRVYFGSWDQHVYALDAASGSEIWRFDTGGIVQASPAYGDGKIVIGSRNPKIFALDAGTGEPVWEYVHQDGSWVESSAVFAAGVFYIGSSDALALQALDAARGTESWRHSTGGWAWGTPLVTEDTVYQGAIAASPYYFEGVTLERGFHAVERRTGFIQWSFETEGLEGGFLRGGVYSSPATADGVVFVGALDGRLYALSR